MTTELTASNGSVQNSRETLVNDLKRVVVDADGLLKEVVSSSADQLAAARSKIEARLGEAKSRINDARITATSKASRAADATQDYVRDNPMKVFGVAALIGLLAAFLLSRRSSRQDDAG